MRALSIDYCEPDLSHFQNLVELKLEGKKEISDSFLQSIISNPKIKRLQLKGILEKSESGGYSLIWKGNFLDKVVPFMESFSHHAEKVRTLVFKDSGLRSYDPAESWKRLADIFPNWNQVS